MRVVEAFNDAINRADLDALVALMTDDHRFVDSAGSVTAGRIACAEAWRSFFASFPDYRNVFESVTHEAAGPVVATGHSTCTAAALAGPARWEARVLDGLVAEWRVCDP